MNRFEERKEEILQPIFFEAGAALYDCQSFEYCIAYLIYLFSRFGATEIDISRAESILNDDEKRTAGQLILLLKKHVTVSKKIEDGLIIALQARNRLIHRYLIDNIERMTDQNEHKKITKEIRDLRAQVRKSCKQLDSFVRLIAEMLDGIQITQYESEIKVNFLKNTQKSHNSKKPKRA